MTHEYGGQVYLDGANMNAQVSHPFCNRLFLKLILSFFFKEKGKILTEPFGNLKFYILAVISN